MDATRKPRTPAAKASAQQQPVNQMTITELPIAFASECLGWKDAGVDSDRNIYVYSKKGEYLSFNPRSFDDVMQAVRDWLSAMDANEIQEKYKKILLFRFGEYFVGAKFQAEVCNDLMAACIEARRREK
jgi:hypothetical protein